MTPTRTYLDWNATQPLRPQARAAMIDALSVVGNPSSVHAEGRRARALVETAREAVAALVGAAPADVVFTSGATEANAWVAGAGWDTVFVSGIEHDSVLAPARAACRRVIELPAHASGLAATAVLADRIAGDGGTFGRALVALQLANNETGVIQPVAAAAAIARAHGMAILTDAVQAAGRIPVDMAALGVDFLSLSSHKLGGPKGVGALIVRDGVVLKPMIAGGGQERRRRSGTENVPGIAGFGAAARAALAELGAMARVGLLRDNLERAVLHMTPQARVIGCESARLANTACIAMPGRSAETLVIALDLAGIAVSAGAACSSGKVGASTILSAMGIAPELAAGAIRISLGPTTTAADVAAFETAWRQIAVPRAKAA